MSRAKQLALRISEIRARLGVISSMAVADLTDEIRAEGATLETEFRDSESLWRAATVAEQTDEERARAAFGNGPQETELRALTARANVGNIFSAALEHRQIDGPEAELQKHFHLAGNQVPLAMLRQVEQRAVTAAPSDVGRNQSEIIPGVFPASIAQFLNIPQPTVGPGEATYPVMSNATVEALAENAAGTESDSVFSADNLAPGRLQASFFFSREDSQRFRGMADALRANLATALMDGLDKELVSGDEGLLEGTNLANHNANAETTFAGYLANMAFGRVDGTYATSLADLRIVMGQATYAHAGGEYRGNNASDPAAERLQSITGGLRVSSHVPAVSASKQNSVIRLGSRMDAVQPIWEGVSIIVDEVTKAANGQIVITAVMLAATKILRSAGFYKQQTQHA